MVGFTPSTHNQGVKAPKSTKILITEEGVTKTAKTGRKKKSRAVSLEMKNLEDLSAYELLGSFMGFMLYIIVLAFMMFTLIILSQTAADVVKNTRNSGKEDFGTSVLTYTGKSGSRLWQDPPPHQDLAAVARYVMHISEWGSLATNSTRKGIEGYPFVNVFSVSDGPVDNATGVPYFFLTPRKLSVIDLKENNKVSFTVTEAQSNYCNKKGYDPEDPRCVRIIFTGLIEKIEKGSEEESFAKNALFSRHKELKNWPSGHDWFFAKLNIIHIYVLDYFGGVGVVSLDDYFAVNPFDKNYKN